MARYATTERVGINAVEAVVVRDFNWIWREQTISDMGIDAQIELVESEPTGRLVAVQVKCGLSNFREKDGCLWYYGSLVHLDYWMGHSLPVIIVAHLPERGITVWEAVTADSVTRTRSKWKIKIPIDQVFGVATKSSLVKYFDGDKAQQRARALAMDEPLMRHVITGGKVSVDIEKWVNKSLGRSPVTVYVHGADGNEIVARELFFLYAGYGIKDLVEAIFPWSTASLDEEFYDENFEGDEDDSVSRFSDDEWIDHRRNSSEIYPYCQSSGEVESYRLRLDLNQLGLSYTQFSNYLSK
ncbi:DUF4365 domain-containing protein [Xanthomonas arboricola]|uniref:DUF4365 domain-containing protein n=1 Tax=Xanthomonas arboricola TaxID=56448 RepID=A0A2S7AEF0_9XANT|nr:DUF4365 domain-containing protein [Xanthomonas arboricola]PPU08130.1 hypothetical protein XarjCFBP7645_11315 [Xanthomonas arboricola]